MAWPRGGERYGCGDEVADWAGGFSGAMQNCARRLPSHQSPFAAVALTVPECRLLGP